MRDKNTLKKLAYIVKNYKKIDFSNFYNGAEQKLFFNFLNSFASSSGFEFYHTFKDFINFVIEDKYLDKKSDIIVKSFENGKCTSDEPCFFDFGSRNLYAINIVKEDPNDLVKLVFRYANIFDPNILETVAETNWKYIDNLFIEGYED